MFYTAASINHGVQFPLNANTILGKCYLTAPEDRHDDSHPKQSYVVNVYLYFATTVVLDTSVVSVTNGVRGASIPALSTFATTERSPDLFHMAWSLASCGYLSSFSYI